VRGFVREFGRGQAAFNRLRRRAAGAGDAVEQVKSERCHGKPQHGYYGKQYYKHLYAGMQALFVLFSIVHICSRFFRSFLTQELYHKAVWGFKRYCQGNGFVVKLFTYKMGRVWPCILILRGYMIR